MTTETQDAKSKPNPLYDPKVRAVVIQIVVIALFVGFIYYIVQNTAANLATLGISTGYDFMGIIAGFMPTSPNFNLTNFDVNKSTHADVFILGLVNTLLISAIGIVLATIVGFVMGVMRLSSNVLVRFVAAVYIEGTRNVPLLLQILVWYFGVILLLPGVKQSLNFYDLIFLNQRQLIFPKPIFGDSFLVTVIAFLAAVGAVFALSRWANKRQNETGEQFPVFWTSVAILITVPMFTLTVTGFPIEWDVPALKGFNFQGGAQVPAQMQGLLLALVFYTGAFIAENVRSGIQSVSHGQTEASFALGLRSGKTMKLVIIPQAMRVIVPPVTSQYLNLVKNSSLAIAIGYPDLVNIFTGISLNQTGKAIEIIGLTMLVYLTISLLISMYMNWYNKRVALVER